MIPFPYPDSGFRVLVLPFYFQGRQVLCSGGEDQEVEVVLKYVDQDKLCQVPTVRHS